MQARAIQDRCGAMDVYRWFQDAVQERRSAGLEEAVEVCEVMRPGHSVI